MNKRILGIMLLAAGLCSSQVLAAANVANTSKKGSLLIFPAIDVSSENSANTLIEISNDQTSPVHVECYYVNERKDRVDFDFDLTPKATASWEVLTGSGTISAPSFPSGGTFTVLNGSPTRGELVCFAVDQAGLNQIAFNHLTGTATQVYLADTDAQQAKQAYRYNAWSFTARGTTGGAADNTVQGQPVIWSYQVAELALTTHALRTTLPTSTQVRPQPERDQS